MSFFLVRLMRRRRGKEGGRDGGREHAGWKRVPGDAKRLVGGKWADKMVQSDMKHWACQGHGQPRSMSVDARVIGGKVAENEVQSDMKHWGLVEGQGHRHQCQATPRMSSAARLPTRRCGE